ncbi:MAG: ThuA domain-containing protein [Clostridia bacterium]|nr:ThuA domain-containing protein [Clostridia bacterium]
MADKIRVTFWHEFRHEKRNEYVSKLYPGGIHAVVCGFLNEESDIEATFVSLDDPEQGLTDELLENTDVLLWWGHLAHGEVKDDLVEKIAYRVMAKGMGFIPLHSGHKSKPFQRIVGSTGNLSWGDNQREIIWNINPAHPIAAGIPDHFLIESEEMYGEPFYIPQPDELVFASCYENGNIFRSGLCYNRGAGKVFYFQPGHETCKSFYDPNVRKIIVNAVRWAKPADFGFEQNIDCTHITSSIKDEFNK